MKRFRTRHLAYIAVPLAVLGTLAVVVAAGHGQVNNTFSNVSAGLGGGGGGAGLADTSSGPASGAGSGSGPAAPPGAAQPTSPGISADLGKPQGQVERDVTASFVVPHDSFQSSFQTVISNAAGLGGYVLSSDTQPDASGRMVQGTVVMKVPADKLPSYLAGLPSSFVTSSVNFSSVDHTQDFVNQTAQLDIDQETLDALNRALKQTSDPATIATLQQQVQQAKETVDRDQGALNVTNGAVAMSTVTIKLSEAGTPPAPTPAPVNPISSSAQTGWQNDIAIGSAVLLVVITGWPVLLILGVAWWQVRRLRGRISPLRPRSLPFVPDGPADIPDQPRHPDR